MNSRYKQSGQTRHRYKQDTSIADINIDINKANNIDINIANAKIDRVIDNSEQTQYT